MQSSSVWWARGHSNTFCILRLRMKSHGSSDFFKFITLCITREFAPVLSLVSAAASRCRGVRYVTGPPRFAVLARLFDLLAPSQLSGRSP